YPVKAVQTLDSIIRDAEAIPTFHPAERRRSGAHLGHTQALCEAACTLADLADAQAIVAITRAGSTARRLSALRPNARTVAATERDDTARRLMLHWGVVPFVMKIGEALEGATGRVAAAVVEHSLVEAGATAVFISVNDDLTRRDANYLKIHRL